MSHHDVREWWDAEACGTQFAHSEKYSPAYFEEVEKARYALEPFIPSFAAFSEYRGKKVLEVGVGAATDFTNWVRGGARAFGVDLTEEAVEHARRRLAMEGLEAEEVRQGDAEALPYPDDSFDLVYSWGVIHHTPDPFQALREIVRVTRPGGEVKVMVYHRHSVAALMVWLRHCALRGRPWRTLSWAVAHHVESPGTRAYTKDEVRAMARDAGLAGVEIRTVLTWCDLASTSASVLYRGLCRTLAGIGGGDRVGWFLLLRGRRAS